MPKTLLWFRPSPFRTILIISLYSGLCMMIGVLMVGAGLDASGRITPTYHPIFLILGMIFVVGSAAFACWNYFQTLRKDDSILVLNTHQIVWSTNKQRHTMDWMTLQSIVQTKKNICLHGIDSQLLLPKGFLGISDKKLAKIILETQKKVLLGVLK